MERGEPVADPVVEAYKRDIDRSLIRRNLARSVEERLEALMELQRFAQELRRAGRASRARWQISRRCCECWPRTAWSSSSWVAWLRDDGAPGREPDPGSPLWLTGRSSCIVGALGADLTAKSRGRSIDKTRAN